MSNETRLPVVSDTALLDLNAALNRVERASRALIRVPDLSQPAVHIADQLRTLRDSVSFHTESAHNAKVLDARARGRRERAIQYVEALRNADNAFPCVNGHVDCALADGGRCSREAYSLID